MPELPPDYSDNSVWGLFHYNLSFNVGYCNVIHSASSQILTILTDTAPFNTVRQATDIPDQSMWVFSFVKNPYDRALLTWNEDHVDLILDPAGKAAQFYADMLVVAGDPRSPKGSGDGRYRTQSDLLYETLGGADNGGRKANFIGRTETFQTDMATVETQMGVDMEIGPLDEIGYPDYRGESVLVDKDTVLADTTYDSFLAYDDAYSSQTTKDLVYNIYREDFDTYLYNR